MPNKVFWSWQSDVSPRETRDLIREALLAAIEQISASFEEADRPELDQDTRGVPGTPDIVATILDKIDKASAFVGDVTPITVSETGKQVANPNVLIELGYAKKAIGPSRIVLVWNTAIRDSSPEDLPFDLRHRRGPISYSLAIGAGKSDLRLTRQELTKRLVDALTDILSSLPTTPAPEIPWQPSEDDDPGIWKGNSAGLPVNHGGSGPDRVTVDNGPLGYARLLPSKWSVAENALGILQHPVQHPVPLGRFGGLNWGPTTGGYLVYRDNNTVQESGVTATATRWFRATGELWGIDASFIREENGDPTYSELYAAERWMTWLKQCAMVCRVTGGDFPFRVRLGIEQLMDVRWARANYDFSVPHALEESATYEFELVEDEDQLIRQHVRHALNRVREVFGLALLSEADFEALASRIH
jgi:hypothetical protein